MKRFFPKLESLRGIAAIAVALYHSTFFQLGEPNQFIGNCYLFVDFFFILSGFVMTGAYQAKIIGGLNFRDYFITRFGRIYPLHLFFLLVWTVFVALKWILYLNHFEMSDPFIKNTLPSFISNLFLLQSLNLHTYTSWNYPSWSVSLEFFTYFIFFLYVVLFRKKVNAVLSLLICIGSYFYLFNETGWTTIDFTVIDGIYRSVGGFFAGVFLFQISIKLPPVNVYFTALMEFAAIALIYLAVLNAAEAPFWLFSVIPIFVFSIFVFSQSNDGFIGKLLNLKPFTYAGKYSYSIYMSHAVIIDLIFSLTQYFYLKPTEPIFFFQSKWSNLINLCLIALIYAVSVFTYRLIEKPWIRKSKEFVRKLNIRDADDLHRPILS